MVVERKRAKSRQRRPTYTEAENEILRETVDRLVDVHGTQGKVGLLLGVTQGFISAFLKKKETAGGSFARAIAETVDVPLPELLGWADAAEKAESDDPYPNRRKALRAARLVKLSEHAIQTVRAIRIAPGRPSPLRCGGSRRRSGSTPRAWVRDCFRRRATQADAAIAEVAQSQLTDY